MKYRTLSLLGTGGIPYRKELREYAGSVTGSLLMQQLDYWFAYHPDGFYKFLDPTPKHPDYREGDSWTEELGFSKAEFRTAFDAIGVRHLSKSAYVQSPDKFAGKDGEKFYCSYHDKKNGLTWYFRNHPKVDQLIDEFCKAKPAKHGKKPSSVDKQPESTGNVVSESTVNQESESTGNVVSESIEINNVDLHRSTNLIYRDQESESTFYIQKISSEINSNTTHKSVEGEISNPEQPTDTLDNKTEICNPPITPPEDLKIAAPPLNQVDNSFVSGRPQNIFKNCGVSVASDPWMLTAKNPHKEFAQWVADKRYTDKSKTPLADAKAEIRNNSDRASDLWDEYQAEMAAKAQKIAAIEQIPQKPTNPAPTAENQAEKYAFTNDPNFQFKAAAMKARLLAREEQEKANKSRKKPCRIP